MVIISQAKKWVCRLFSDRDKDAPIILSVILAEITFVFLLLTLTCLLFPSDGIDISSKSTLTFPKLKEALGLNYDDAGKNLVLNCAEGEEMFSNIPSEPERRNKSTILPARCTPDDIRMLSIQPIEYPKGKKNMLQNTWLELANARNSRPPMRILHYGDSQLEADRMTLYLRSQLQRQFGGGGVGFIALDPQIPINPTIKLSLSPNWEHSVPAVKSKPQDILRVGHMLSSIKLSSPQNKHAWIKIDRRPLRTYPALRYTCIKMQLINTGAPITIEARTPSKVLYAQTIKAGDQMQMITINTRANRENITINFKGRGCPEIYGLALDYRTGVAVDNIPLRSSSGVDFTKADFTLLQRSYELINPKLIILQFGANVIPKMMSSYRYYEEQLFEQLMLLKEIVPDANILVVGVSDMARRKNGVFSSYPNIESVRDAQKSATFRAGCAFWDAFEAMGGRNSIVSWVYAQPALASKDFCHFSADGATLIAELFHRSLRQEYRQCLNQVNHNNYNTRRVAENNTGR
ncbi:MAG: hypothetical protein LBH34_01795 [Prevotellaceae bacterium]|jgi:hypothetical protein|nr:hypothetical protein [Prevotellaceae bacterium]